MSAITGIHYFDGQPVAPSALEQMVDILAHRGPDGSGVWCEGAVGLGHRMLWTTPESLHEQLPRMNRPGNLVITADARIDNRDDLIRTLGLTDRPAGDISDSDLILAAYERWGERCPEELLGDFAFAIWDRREQRLFCARDHFGVKPFYYYASNRMVALAGEIKALLTLPEVPRRINETKIADYLILLLEDRISTFYQDILRLPPGHCLTVRNGKAQTRCYWQLERLPELRLKSNTEYAEGYRAIFTEAVRCRMRSAFPIGSMLSGGLDSSSITCVARTIACANGQSPLQTFSAIFDEVPESDERPYMQAVLAQGDLIPNFIHGDRVTPLTDLERVLRHVDEPFFAPNLFLNWAMWEQANRQGVRVLLDGIMGDSTAAHGYEYFDELAYRGRWLRLAREMGALCRRHDQPLWPILRRQLWQVGIKAHVPAPALAAWRRLRGYPNCADDSSPISPLLNADFADRQNLPERVRMLEGERTTPTWSAREAHYRGLTTGHITSALEAFDRGVAAFGIEARLPFMDRRLVEFCLALPPGQKLQDGWNRSIVRRGLTHVLPEAIRNRPDKGNLGHNFRRGLAADDRRIRAVLDDTPDLVAPYLSITALQDLYRRFLAQDRKTDADITVLLLALILATWLRHDVIEPDLVGEEVIATTIA
jgi:asparagine synthase (glutamine-hydrolysing)